MVAFLKNLLAKKVLTRRTRVAITDLHQVHLVPFDQGGNLIDEQLKLRDISLEGFAIQASLEEWGFSRGMELEANLHLWDKVFVVRFRFLHLHDNFSGGKILKASNDYEHEFFNLFEPELQGEALLADIKNNPGREIYKNGYCGIRLNQEDFVFFYKNKIVRSYHEQIKVFDYDLENPIKFKELNQHTEIDEFDLEDLHTLMRFLLIFKDQVNININQIASDLQERFRKALHL